MTLVQSSFAADAAPTRYVEVGDLRLAYRVIGPEQAPPVVLAMRFRGVMDEWDPAFLDSLATNRRVYWFDSAGIGRLRRGARFEAGGPARLVDGRLRRAKPPVPRSRITCASPGHRCGRLSVSRAVQISWQMKPWKQFLPAAPGIEQPPGGASGRILHLPWWCPPPAASAIAFKGTCYTCGMHRICPKSSRQGHRRSGCTVTRRPTAGGARLVSNVEAGMRTVLRRRDGR